MSAHHILAIIVLVAFLALLTACGQKGDLYLPDDAHQERKG